MWEGSRALCVVRCGVCVQGSVRVGYVYSVPRGGGLCGGVLFVPYVCLSVWCPLIRFA